MWFNLSVSSLDYLFRSFRIDTITTIEIAIVKISIIINNCILESKLISLSLPKRTIMKDKTNIRIKNINKTIKSLKLKFLSHLH